MKKLFLFAAILFAGVSVANAQVEKGTFNTVAHKEVAEVSGATESTAKTQLKVTLNTVQSISVNSTGVHLEYTTIEDYKEGVKTPSIPDHLNVYSTGSYAISVFYDNVQGEGDSSEGALAANALFETIKIKVDDGDAKTLIKQADNNSNIVTSSATGAYNKMYSVEYIGSGFGDDDDAGMGYMNNIKDGAKKVYTADVIYTIEPA